MTNDMREKIEAVIREELAGQAANPDHRFVEYGVEGAEIDVEGHLHLSGLARAIIAALPDILKGMVQPLEWAEGAFVSSPVPYQIWTNNGGSGAPDDPLVHYENFMVFDPHMNAVGEFEEYEDAIAAANAHHVAQALKPFLGKTND